MISTQSVQTQLQQQTFSINNHNIFIKEYQGKRVITFKDVDTAHERVEGTARKRFNSNKEHFVENMDYYKVPEKELRLLFGRNSKRGNPNVLVVLLTESGYLMLVKSLNDPLAWKVQRELVNNYFRAKDIVNENVKDEHAYPQSDPAAKEVPEIESEEIKNIFTENESKVQSSEYISNCTKDQSEKKTENYKDEKTEDYKEEQETHQVNSFMYKGVPVTTSTQLALHYKVNYPKLYNFFWRFQSYFEEGVHYFILKPNEERELREKYGLNTKNKLYLWTRKGSLMFTKLIHNDVGWSQYKVILDALFKKIYGEESDGDKKETSSIEYIDKNFKCTNENKNGTIEEKEVELPKESKIANESIVAPQMNWYQKNTYKLDRICKSLDMTSKELNYQIITRLQEKYDMKVLGEMYKERLGDYPKYALDIINLSPEIRECADNILMDFMLSIINSFSILKGIMK